MHRVYDKEKTIRKRRDSSKVHNRDERERDRRDTTKRDHHHHRDDKHRSNIRDGLSRDYSVERHQSDKPTREGSSRDERDKKQSNWVERRPLSTHKRKERGGDTEELLDKHDKRAKSSKEEKKRDKHRHVDDTRDLNGINREKRKERRTFGAKEDDDDMRAANKNVTFVDMEKQQQQQHQHPVVTPASAKPCASGMPTLPGLANVPNFEAVKRAQELAAKMGFHQDPEFAPLINMFPGQMPVEVAVQQKPAKTPVLRLDALGIEIDEHGNVTNMPKLTNLSTLKFNINKQKMETFQILKPELDVDPESNPQYDESMGIINKAKLLRLKRMSFEFVEEGTWSKQTEIFKFKSQFGEAQAKELKNKQAQLAKAKAEEPDINPNLIEVSERIITKEKLKDVIPDVEWWDVPLLLSGTYCDITEDSITEDKLKLDKITIYVEHPLPIEPPAEPAPPLPIEPPAEPASLPPQPLKLTKQGQKKLCTQRRLAKEKDRPEMIRQGLLEPPKANVKMSNLIKVLGSEATPSRDRKPIWKLVWKLKTTHIVQLFLRNLLSDSLVTISDSNCPWCPSPETSMHLFVNCDLAKNVWALANIHNPTNISESTTFMEWFSYWTDNQRIQKSLKIQILSSVCCVLWAIWDSRNNSIFKNVPPIPEQIFKKARSMLIPDNPWELPPIDYLKLNFDGAWNCTTKLGFTGWIIRDHLGHFVAGGADRGQFSSAKETEAYALLDGLKFIINTNLRKVICEGDAQILINQIINNNKKPADSPSTEAIIRDCIYLLGYCNFVNLCWVNRTFNGAADHIALWAKQTNISFKQCWSSPPCWLEEDLIRGDVNPPLCCSLLRRQLVSSQYFH